VADGAVADTDSDDDQADLLPQLRKRMETHPVASGLLVCRRATGADEVISAMDRRGLRETGDLREAYREHCPIAPPDHVLTCADDLEALAPLSDSMR